jgi:phage shock protein PspC (stress-responsive transcriptional regulator)
MLSDGKLRWPRWFIRVLAIFFIAALGAGFIYAYVVFQAVSERSQHPHVHPHSTH